MDSWSSEREAQVGLVTPSAQEDGGLRRVPWRAGFGIYTCWLVAQEGHVTCQASVSKPARWKQCQKFFPGRPDPGCSLMGLCREGGSGACGPLCAEDPDNKHSRSVQSGRCCLGLSESRAERESWRVWYKKNRAGFLGRGGCSLEWLGIPVCKCGVLVSPDILVQESWSRKGKNQAPRGRGAAP